VANEARPFGAVDKSFRFVDPGLRSLALAAAWADELRPFGPEGSLLRVREDGSEGMEFGARSCDSNPRRETANLTNQTNEA
jgi:hypothetical protein